MYSKNPAVTWNNDIEHTKRDARTPNFAAAHNYNNEFPQSILIYNRKNGSSTHILNAGNKPAINEA